MKGLTNMKLTHDQINKIIKMKDIPEFPYENLVDLTRAIQSGEVVVGAAMHLARQWVVGGDKEVPSGGRFIVKSLTVLQLLLPLLVLVLAIVSSQLLLLLLIPAMVLSFLFLSPMQVRFKPILNIVIIGHYVLIVLGLINVLGSWAIYLGISVNLLWIITKIMYKVSIDTVVAAAMSNEKLFVWLFKANITGLQFRSGEILWAYNVIEKK